MLTSRKPLVLTALLAALLPSVLAAQSFADFRTPDKSNYPITYWQWMNGNISKEGITKDLEAMKSAGIEGTLLFSTNSAPRGPVGFFTPEWWDCVEHTIRESDRLGMKFGVYNCDGWSMSGGPWITPQESMKQLVWTETAVEGGKQLKLKLDRPRSNENVYEDIAVVAFPALPAEASSAVKIMSAAQVADAENVADGDISKAASFLNKEGAPPPSLTIDLGESHTLRRIVFEQLQAVPFLDASAKVEGSLDGENWNILASQVPLNLKAESFLNQITWGFNATEARYVKVTVSFLKSFTPVPMKQDFLKVGEIYLSGNPRVSYWEPKSGETKRIRHDRQQVFIKEMNSRPDDDLPLPVSIGTSEVITLTDHLENDGTLKWDAPPGDWIVQRIGYTSTGRYVSPATREGRGLECDKMDARAVEKHFNAYTAKIIDLSEKLVGRPIDYMQMESWEAGIQNWTEGFEQEFERRNGYSLFPYLPVLAGGYVVGSYEEADRFLWDFRNTVSHLIAENYWKTMYQCAAKRGVTVSGEGSGMQHYLYDPIRYMQHLDVPMGEFWSNEPHARADIKNAASVANTLGRELAGAEAFTSGDANIWAVTPYDLKKIGDEAFSLGCNFFVMHSYVHQPYDQWPGFTLGKFGNHFHRLNPWFNQSQGWFDYLARCQYMLRQGKPVRDLAYFTGEGIPSYLGLPWELQPILPPGYDYDGVNLELLKSMVVKDGDLCTPVGACYRLLAVPDGKAMTAALAGELARLVKAGATVVSAKPARVPTLAVSAGDDDDLARVADELWGAGANGDVPPDGRAVGKGRIYTSATLERVLAVLKVKPDFIYRANDGGGHVNYAHRTSEYRDVYFVANYEERIVSGSAQFRVAGKSSATVWDPDRGSSRTVTLRALEPGLVELPLELNPLESVFVVFDGATAPVPAQQLVEDGELESKISRPWRVEFRSPSETFSVSLDDLSDWSTSADERVKYFSGTATYTNTFDLSPEATGTVKLDLGEVNRQIAVVNVNGREVARLWKPPYFIDVSPYVKPGKNELKLSVTNTAVNALIGDERFDADTTYTAQRVITEIPEWVRGSGKRGSERKTFVSFKSLTADSKLDPSGLVGPVVLRQTVLNPDS